MTTEKTNERAFKVFLTLPPIVLIILFVATFLTDLLIYWIYPFGVFAMLYYLIGMVVLIWCEK